MKKYFKGNVNALQITKLEINNGKVTDIAFQDTVLQTNQWFYTNLLDKVIRFSDGCPMTDREEAKEYLESQIRNQKKRPPLSNLYIAYVDMDSLQPQAITKEQEKEMIEQRKILRKEQRKPRTTK